MMMMMDGADGVDDAVRGFIGGCRVTLTSIQASSFMSPESSLVLLLPLTVA